MAKIKKTSKQSKKSLREVFQALLQSRVKNIAAQEQLARDLNVSKSLVKKMIYSGEGGLDVWGQAFHILFDWDDEFLMNLTNEFKKQNQVSSEADKIWYSLRDDMNASDSEMYYLASCAKEALRIKKEIDLLKIKKKIK
jgi:hypothetical protein